MGSKYSTMLHSIRSEYFSTDSGNYIPYENENGYDEKFMKELNRVIRSWILFPSKSISPASRMTPEQIKYIQDHMELSSTDKTIEKGHMYRVENNDHFKDHNYAIGDVLDDSAIFRSFNRSIYATFDYIKNKYKDIPEGNITIYRTNGDVPHFNLTKWFKDEDSAERESLIEPKKLKIKNIINYRSSDEDEELFGKGEVMSDFLHNYTGHYYNDTKSIPREVTIVDLEPI